MNHPAATHLSSPEAARGKGRVPVLTLAEP